MVLFFVTCIQTHVGTVSLGEGREAKIRYDVISIVLPSLLVQYHVVTSYKYLLYCTVPLVDFLSHTWHYKRKDLYLFSFYFEKTKSRPVVLATCTTPLSVILTHPSMYKVPIRWYNLSLICIRWMPGPDFGVLGMCSSHWKVVKGVMQPRTWENGPFGRVCDLV
jgi:hypothetical protein